MLFLLLWFCQAFRCRGLMIRITAMKNGSPAMITVDSVTFVENMNTTMNTRLMISRIMLMIPLDRISDTELT